MFEIARSRHGPGGRPLSLPGVATKSAWVWTLLAMSALHGCGRPERVEPSVTTHLGAAQVCHHCLKTIDPVQEENMFVAGGAQYVVCGRLCEQGVRQSLENQGVLVPGADK